MIYIVQIYNSLRGSHTSCHFLYTMVLGELPHHYTKIPHCFLCGEKFRSDSYFHSGILHWCWFIPAADNVLVISTQYQQLVLTWPLSFQGGYGTITLQDLNVQIHEEPRISSKNAPSVHRLCWVVLVNRPSNHQLCDLGIAMTPLVWTGLPQNIYQDHLTLFKAIYKLRNFKNNNKKTTLYELLERSQNLPTELIAIIWDFIAPCTIRCLLSLSATENTWPDCSSAERSGTISLYGDIAVYRTCVLDGHISAAFARETTFMDMRAVLLSMCQSLHLSLLLFSKLECMGFEV